MADHRQPMPWTFARPPNWRREKQENSTPSSKPIPFYLPFQPNGLLDLSLAFSPFLSFFSPRHGNNPSITWASFKPLSKFFRAR